MEMEMIKWKIWIGNIFTLQGFFQEKGEIALLENFWLH